MDLNWDSSVSGQQKAWALDALAHIRYPLDEVPVVVNVSVVEEPPCEGHKDYMCTSTDDGLEFDLHIRERADDPTADFNRGLPDPVADIKQFYMESITHEVGHVITFHFLNNDTVRATAASYFTLHKALGDGYLDGTLADWDPPSDTAWVNRLKEGMAETFKDVFLPESLRVFDNRSNWDLKRDKFADFMPLIFPVSASFDWSSWGEDLGVYGFPGPPIVSHVQTYEGPVAVPGGFGPPTGYPGPVASGLVADPDDWPVLEGKIIVSVPVGASYSGDDGPELRYAVGKLADIILEGQHIEVTMDNRVTPNPEHLVDPDGLWGYWEFPVEDPRGLAAKGRSGEDINFTVALNYDDTRPPGWNPNTNLDFPFDNVRIDWHGENVVVEVVDPRTDPDINADQGNHAVVRLGDRFTR